MTMLRPFLLAAVCGLLFASTLCAQPTANEQAMIYELNRARQDPQRYDSEQGLGGLLNGILSRPPLAVNDDLVQSARFHADEMATYNYFGHQSAVTGDWPNKMARDAGYPLDTSLSNTANNIESLAAGSTDVLAALKLLIEDAGVNPPGHRYHLLATGPSASFYAQFREVGCGYASNAGSNYVRYYAIHTGWRINDFPFLSGVVYDDLNGNGRYDEGEGLSGVTVAASGPASISTTTNANGGWSLEASNGTWSLTCSGGSFVGTATASANVTTENVEVDFMSGRSSGEVDFEFQVVGGGRVVNASPGVMTFTTPSTGLPTTEQSLSVTADRLQGNVTVTAPAEFQVSDSTSGPWGLSLTLTPTAGSINTTIYVRFNPSVGGVSSGDLTLTTSGALTETVSLSGTVTTSPTIFVSLSSDTYSANRLGTMSPEHSFSVSGYNLTQDITVSAPAEFEVSLSSGSGFGSSVAVTQSGGTVNPTTVYARYVPTSLNTSGNIACSSSGATTQNIAVTASVANVPVITVAPASLTLSSPSAGVNSAESTFTVEGQFLDGDITVTAPAGFAISDTSGTGFGATVTLTPTAGDVALTTLYAIFQGIAGGSSGDITAASNLATTQTVALTGNITPPTINVSQTSLSFQSTGQGTPSSVKSYQVSGTDLVGSVDLTVTGEFEISDSGTGGWGTTLTLNPTGGTLAATTVFVRFMPVTTIATANGSIDHASTYATNQTVNLTGAIYTGGGSSGGGGGGEDSGGGGCAGGSSTAPWLLALLLLAIPALRRRRIV